MAPGGMGAQAADSAAAERVHGLMVAAGVAGNDRTYNTLVKVPPATPHSPQRCPPSTAAPARVPPFNASGGAVTLGCRFQASASASASANDCQ